MKILALVPIMMVFLLFTGFSQTDKLLSETLPWEKFSHLEIDSLERLTATVRKGEGKTAASTLELTQLVALAKAYEAYREQYYNAPLSAEYLYRAAVIYDAFLGESRKALFVYGDLHENFKDHNRHAEAVFKIALIYSNRYQDTVNAKIWYDYFLLVYPNHSLAPLANMGRDMLEKPAAENTSRQ